MKQDFVAWKFRTQNLVVTYTLTLMTNFGKLPRVYFRHTNIILNLGKLGVQRFKRYTNWS